MPKEKPKPGPDAETLALPGNWKERVDQALQKKKPEGGWPKPDKPEKKGAEKP